MKQYPPKSRPNPKAPSPVTREILDAVEKDMIHVLCTQDRQCFGAVSLLDVGAEMIHGEGPLYIHKEESRADGTRSHAFHPIVKHRTKDVWTWKHNLKRKQQLIRAAAIALCAAEEMGNDEPA